MYRKYRNGHHVVAASRFISGGCMVGAPWLKSLLVRSSAFTLYYLARLPARDASNGLRLFSRRLLDRARIESSVGFAYGIELLVKCHRLGWKIAEIPAVWYERTSGRSRFQSHPLASGISALVFSTFLQPRTCAGAPKPYRKTRRPAVDPEPPCPPRALPRHGRPTRGAVT